MKRRADGRYLKVIVDARTKQNVYIYGNTEREIQQKMLEFTEKQEIGRSWIEVCAEWWKEHQKKIEYQTARGYESAIKRINAYFNTTPVRNITPKDISVFFQKMSLQKYSHKTISNHKLIINLVLTHAVLENDIEINPCISVSIPKGERNIRSAASSRDEQIIKNATHLWLFPFVALMTGMRKGELLALQWSDIDFENNIISVTKSIYFEGDKPFIKKPKTKTGIRKIPLLAPLKEILLTKAGKPKEYIFSDDKKTPLTSRRFRTLFEKYQQQTGITCTPHQLRHSFATIAFECGAEIKTIQEILGHKHYSTTMDIYTEFRKTAFDTFSKLLNEHHNSTN